MVRVSLITHPKKKKTKNFLKVLAKGVHESEKTPGKPLSCVYTGIERKHNERVGSGNTGMNWPDSGKMIFIPHL